MKQIIYITKNKVWIADSFIDWKEGGLAKLFEANRKKINTYDLKIVLGNEVSYLCSFLKKETDELTREWVKTQTQNHLPIEISDENFDWKEVKIGEEVWIQSVAVDKTFLEQVSRAIKENRLKVNLMIPIGILIGERSIWKKYPVLVKWSGAEKLTALAVRGLVDSVYSGISDQEINNYAKSKWVLAADPEVLILDEKNFKISEEVYNEKSKGDDSEVLSITVFRNLEPVPTQPLTPVSAAVTAAEPIVEAESSKPNWEIPALIIVILLLLGGLFWFFFIFKWGGNPLKTEQSLGVIISPTITATPSPTVVEKIDLGKYRVQVLNASGVTGVAAGIRDSLVATGFGTVEVGNAPNTEIGTIRTKATVPAGVLSQARESIRKYTLEEGKSLAAETDFDVIIVIGSASL